MEVEIQMLRPVLSENNEPAKARAAKAFEVELEYLSGDLALRTEPEESKVRAYKLSGLFEQLRKENEQRVHRNESIELKRGAKWFAISHKRLKQDDQTLFEDVKNNVIRLQEQNRELLAAQKDATENLVKTQKSLDDALLDVEHYRQQTGRIDEELNFYRDFHKLFSALKKRSTPRLGAGRDAQPGARGRLTMFQ